MCPVSFCSHWVVSSCNTSCFFLCRWLVLAMAMVRFYIQKGTHKGLYRSIARTLKFFQTFALVEVRIWVEKRFAVTCTQSLTWSVLIFMYLVFTGGTLCHRYVTIFVYVLWFILTHKQMCTILSAAANWCFISPLLCCRNRENFCDCNRGSSVFTDFHGLVHHQQHQTGDCHITTQTLLGCTKSLVVCKKCTGIRYIYLDNSSLLAKIDSQCLLG